MQTQGFMDLAEFVEGGYLQELNRRFLHPIGLSLAVYIVDGRIQFAGIVDGRQDPAGLKFTRIDPQATLMAAKMEQEMQRRHEARRMRLGYVVQPLPVRE